MSEVRRSLLLNARVTQTKAFVDSNLPLTAELARTSSEYLLPLLPSQTRLWPLEDRVLAFLLPSLHDEVIRFHSGNGKDLLGLFAAGGMAAVSHLDAEAVGILLSRIKAEAPSLYEQILRLSGG